MVSVIFFDLGGVIFYDFFSGGDREFVTSLNLPPKPIYDAYVKTDLAEYVEGKMDDVKRWKMFTEELDLPENKIQACIEAFYRGYKPIKEMVAFVQELKQNFSNLKLGVLSDQPGGVVKLLRSRYKEVFGLFDDELVLISAEVGLSKQAESLEIYREALRRANKQASEVMFVDNSRRNIRNSASLGMRVFFFDIEKKTVNSLMAELKKEIIKMASPQNPKV